MSSDPTRRESSSESKQLPSSSLPLHLTTIGLALTLAVPALAQEQNMRENARSISLWTETGLGFCVNKSDGSVKSISVGGRDVEVDPVPLLRFEEVIEIPDAPNLLGQWDKTAWGVDAGDADDAWLKVPGADTEKPRRTILVDQSQPSPLILSGSCKYEAAGEAEGWMNRWLAINASCKYGDSDSLVEQSVYFGQYNHGPQANSKIICPDRPISSVDIELSSYAAKNTAWFSDVALRPARYRITSPRTPCERLDARIVQEFDIQESGLFGQLSLQSVNDRIEVRCHFGSTVKTDKAVSAYLAIPVDAVGGVWYDDARTSRVIEEGKVYRNSAWYGAGRSGYYSQYPIAAITTADGAGIALGTALDEPRVLEMEYDAGRRELRVRYDLGLSPDAGRWANRGSFTTFIFAFDGRDGFRGATRQFHDISGWAFRNRVDRQGLWIAFVDPKAVAGGHEDFHFRFVEATSNVGWHKQQEMYSLKYAEPWIHHHEFPPHATPEDVKGSIDPMVTIETARRVAADRSPQQPPDCRARHAAFLGSYIEDNWGAPQGYFFRGGRNENMMIVNPNPHIPPPDGVVFSSGAYDCEINRETGLIWKHWSIPNWIIYRVSEKQFIEVDTQHKVSGSQSVRFDPVRSKGYYSHYTRGISQVLYYDADDSGPFEFSFWARAENAEDNRTTMDWRLEFQSEDDTTDNHFFKIEDLGEEWRKYTFAVTPRHKPAAISLVLVNNPWIPDPSTVWIDDVRLTAEGRPENLLVNAGFEAADLLEGTMGGVYLDTMECYANNINYRRSHWPYAEEPLTFDTARKPGLQQQYSHISYARSMADYVRQRNMILFANCAPATVFAAPYLDVMGGEDNWLHSGNWSPRSDGSFNFARFMCGPKPFCILNYADFDLEQLERYVKRCMFYGVFPGIISSSSTSNKWYWTNAVRVRRDRPVFARYMPLIVEIAEAGWQPITFASSDNGEVWLERFGEGDVTYLTIFNPTAGDQSARIVLDPRLGLTAQSTAFDRTGEESAELAEKDGEMFLKVSIAPEDTRVIVLTR